MKGKLVSSEIAVLSILPYPEAPALAGYQAEVKVDPSVEIESDMIGKTFEFEMKVPCTQHCKRPECSHLNKKVCQEAVCFPGEVLHEIFVLHA
jgi:hypothetical protein